MRALQPVTIVLAFFVILGVLGSAMSASDNSEEFLKKFVSQFAGPPNSTQAPSGSHSDSHSGPGSYSFSWGGRQKRGICLFGLFFCGGEGGKGGSGGGAPGAPGNRF